MPENAIDQLPDDSDPRNDPRLNDPAFIASEEGQAALEAAAKADAQARKDAKAAEAKAKREAAAAKAAADAAARKPGPVEIVQPAIRPVPKPSARGKGGATAKKAAATSTKPTAKKAATPAKPKAPHTPTNAALPLGTKVIDVNGVKQYPILGKDGKALANYQEHNWVWTCAKCSRRLRLAFCTGPKDGSNQHAKVKAPDGYMRESRIVKS